MSSASINDQVRRTVLHHCFQSVRGGTDEQLAAWDALLYHFNIQAPKKEEVPAPATTATTTDDDASQQVTTAQPTATTTTTTTPVSKSREQMQRLGRKLSQLATKMYGLSVDAANNHEMFFICVLLDLKEFEVPTLTAQPVPTVVPSVAPITSSPPALYMDDDIINSTPPPSSVSDVVVVADESPAVVVPAAPVVVPVVVKVPTKRALQVILENFHYSKNPLPQRVRRAPEVLVYDPPTRPVAKKAAPKKSAAAATPPPIVAAAIPIPQLGTKRDRGVVTEKKQSKITTTIKELKPSSSAPGKLSSRSNKNGGLLPPTATTTTSCQPTVAPVHTTNTNALMLSNLMDSSSSYCSTSDDDNDAESGAETTEVMSGGLTVDRQDVFDFKQKKGISALAEDVDYGDDLNDDDDSPEGRRRRKQLKLVEVLRLEGMLTTEIALKVLNSGAGKGGKKAAAASGDGDPPATAADVAVHFDDIIRRGFAVKDFDDTIFLCS